MIQLSSQLSCHILPHCDISRVTQLLYALAELLSPSAVLA